MSISKLPLLVTDALLGMNAKATIPVLMWYIPKQMSVGVMHQSFKISAGWTLPPNMMGYASKKR